MATVATLAVVDYTPPIHIRHLPVLDPPRQRDLQQKMIDALGMHQSSLILDTLYSGWCPNASLPGRSIEWVDGQYETSALLAICQLWPDSLDDRMEEVFGEMLEHGGDVELAKAGDNRNSVVYLINHRQLALLKILGRRGYEFFGERAKDWITYAKERKFPEGVSWLENLQSARDRARIEEGTVLARVIGAARRI